MCKDELMNRGQVFTCFTQKLLGWGCSVSAPPSLTTCKHHISLCNSLPEVERSSSDQFSETVSVKMNVVHLSLRKV